jgi:methyltransferase-like protein
VNRYPRATLFARFLAAEGHVIPNQKGRNVQLTDLARCILQRLDGRHDAQQLAEIVATKRQAGQLALSLYEQGEEQQLVKSTLQHLARATLLEQ